jgi:hypothetical protein
MLKATIANFTSNEISQEEIDFPSSLARNVHKGMLDCMAILKRMMEESLQKIALHWSPLWGKGEGRGE